MLARKQKAEQVIKEKAEPEKVLPMKCCKKN